MVHGYDFKRCIEELGIQPILARVRHPQKNGKSKNGSIRHNRFGKALLWVAVDCGVHKFTDYCTVFCNVGFYHFISCF
ncbi:Mobile element protein [Methanosarcina siciliae C2J]|uniref:Mobile element protein n=1 Tax=Methanosarcina siciliae C2J TaxID=1434118 RepID=A0A0E3PMX6_9EURY|nr:Mobile element protein [Methanosarcina siciliae C2J]